MMLLVSGQRWLLWHELRDAPEPGLPELLARLQPVDLVMLVEAGKAAPIRNWKSGAPPCRINRAFRGIRTLSPSRAITPDPAYARKAARSCRFSWRPDRRLYRRFAR